MFLRFVEDEGHGVARLDVVVNNQFGLIGHAVDGAQGNVALLKRLLEKILVWRDVLLGKSLHLVGVVFVFFFFLATT